MVKITLPMDGFLFLYTPSYERSPPDVALQSQSCVGMLPDFSIEFPKTPS